MDFFNFNQQRKNRIFKKQLIIVYFLVQYLFNYFLFSKHFCYFLFFFKKIVICYNFRRKNRKICIQSGSYKSILKMPLFSRFVFKKETTNTVLSNFRRASW